MNTFAGYFKAICGCQDAHFWPNGFAIQTIIIRCDRYLMGVQMGSVCVCLCVRMGLADSMFVQWDSTEEAWSQWWVICDLVNGKLITQRRQWGARNCKHTYTYTNKLAHTDTCRNVLSLWMLHKINTNVHIPHIIHTIIVNALISLLSMHTHTHAYCRHTHTFRL